MSKFCSCFSTVSSPPLNSIYKTLPHSPKWTIENYKNLDCQPDEEYSEEKRINFHNGLLKLIKYPNEIHLIKMYNNHPDGPITSYLQWHVICKRNKL
tara:strand:+ start:789 stop:1079 length:291 start_codon:yes stop_codon:yes gene_type:complete